MCDEEVAMRWRAYAAALSYAPVLPAPRARPPELSNGSVIGLWVSYAAGNVAPASMTITTASLRAAIETLV